MRGVSAYDTRGEMYLYLYFVDEIFDDADLFRYRLPS